MYSLFDRLCGMLVNVWGLCSLPCPPPRPPEATQGVDQPGTRDHLLNISSYLVVLQPLSKDHL